jgi:hypothetical protein
LRTAKSRASKNIIFDSTLRILGKRWRLISFIFSGYSQQARAKGVSDDKPPFTLVLYLTDSLAFKQRQIRRFLRTHDAFLR